jgi:transcriptional regulator with XRE-family HTH domain
MPPAHGSGRIPPRSPEAAAWGGRLRTHRVRQGLKQSQLAAAIGVTSKTVQRWELGTSAPPADRFDDLEQALGLEPHALAKDLDWVLPGPQAIRVASVRRLVETGLGANRAACDELIRQLGSPASLPDRTWMAAQPAELIQGFVRTTACHAERPKLHRVEPPF